MSAEGGVRKADGDRRQGIVLVCFAMKEEALPYRKAAGANDTVEILVTGIGRVNSERALKSTLSVLQPSVVFTCGFAGGLDPQWPVGQVLFETGEPALRDRLLRAGAQPGRFYCADRIAITAAEKRELRQRTGADAVEMESGTIQALCRERQIPCATVRAISDSASTDLPLDFNQLSKPDLSLDYRQLALAILRSPRRIRGLLALQRNSSRAAAALSELLVKVTG
jgi:nucleoside phosphorylase